MFIVDRHKLQKANIQGLLFRSRSCGTLTYKCICYLQHFVVRTYNSSVIECIEHIFII